MNIRDVTNSDWSLSTQSFGGIVEGYDDIGQSIHLILTTVPGSVPGNPLFGCGIYLEVDKSISRINSLIKLMADSIETFEPRATITEFKYQVLNNGVQDYVKFFIKWVTDLIAGPNIQYTVNPVQSTPSQGFDYTFDFILG